MDNPFQTRRAKVAAVAAAVLVVGALLFSMGLFVALTRRNAVGVLMGVELMLNSVNLNLVGFARLTQAARQIDGQVFAVFVITTATMAISPTRVPDGLARMFLFYCFERSTAVGIPAIIVATLLAAPTLPIRPSVVGALYGFGSGLFADAGWRLFCNVSEPAHERVTVFADTSTGSRRTHNRALTASPDSAGKVGVKFPDVAS